MVKQITSISKPYPDGQRVIAIAVEYDKAIPAKAFDNDAFGVEERNITKVYTASSAEVADAPAEGAFVIIELDPKDGVASTLTDKDGRHKSMPRLPRPDRPGGPGGPGGPGRPGGGPPTIILPDGREFQGPKGIGSYREPIRIPVIQKETVAFADGTEEAAWADAKVTDNEINEWADLFEVRQFEDMQYNLFIPEDYDPAKKYPLVLFIHDAGCDGYSPKIALEQGFGATIFASPEEQKKHPCFVVAPQHAKELPIANDKYWCFDDEHTIKKILDEVAKEYSIDENRIYTTGQSMGFMTSIQLLLDYPDYFAAALLPAGHWDIEKTATLWDRNVWMFLSEDDGGGKRVIAALPDAVEKIGGKIGIYRWDANQPTKKFDELIDSVKNDGNSFHLTIFPTGTIMRPDQPDRTDGGGHNGTWHFVYQIEGARDWLFEQVKK
ncbi:MAG: hypothetical protein E7233_03610 [Lachnospiraceae bacterium]|nr:hypothetical protein [Lachnospiraceae bacterium]